MAKFTAWITTKKVNSECCREFEVPDDELEGLNEDERR